MKYPSLAKFVPYAQNVLMLTINAEMNMGVVIGISLKVYCLELNDWVSMHYNGEKFCIYNENGDTLLDETFCGEYE